MTEFSANPSCKIPSEKPEDLFAAQPRYLIPRTDQPIPVYVPKLQGYCPGLSWICDIVKGFDPAEEPWWGYANQMYKAKTPEEVFIRKLNKMPPHDALNFDVFTKGTDEDARDRLVTVMANMLVLANIQSDPVPAQKLMHPTPEGMPELPSFEEINSSRTE